MIDVEQFSQLQPQIYLRHSLMKLSQLTTTPSPQIKKISNTNKLQQSDKNKIHIVNQGKNIVSSLESIQSTTSHYFQPTEVKKYHRVHKNTKQYEKVQQIEKDATNQADDFIKDANRIANETLNTEAHYHTLEHEPEEYLMLDHMRFINDRILRAEEIKIKMECTPELVDIYRRFLPTTIGRRNVLVQQDLQDAYYQDRYVVLFEKAKNVLSNQQKEIEEQLDALYDFSRRSMEDQ